MQDALAHWPEQNTSMVSMAINDWRSWLDDGESRVETGHWTLESLHLEAGLKIYMHVDGNIASETAGWVGGSADSVLRETTPWSCL